MKRQKRDDVKEPVRTSRNYEIPTSYYQEDRVPIGSGCYAKPIHKPNA